MINYLTRFMGGCVELVSPLTKLTHKKTEFTWDVNTEAVFDRIKLLLSLLQR